MPGSRRLEIECILPAMLGAAGEIARRIPGAQFALALAPSAPRDRVERIIRREQGPGGGAARLQLLMHQAGDRLAQIAQTTLTPPLTRQSFNMETDFAALTPEHTQACKAFAASKKAVGSVAFSTIPTGNAIIRFPGSGGGPEWGGGAFDPKHSLYIINTNDMGTIEGLEQKPGGYWGSTEGADSFFMTQDTHLMCQTPPWGSLTAVNVNTGKIAWRTTLGVTDSLPPALQKTGRPSLGGPIITASGLVFIGGTDDARFRAFDAATGKEIWTNKLDYSAHATPVTYQGKDGKQYVAVVATGGTFLRSPAGGDSLVVFALP